MVSQKPTLARSPTMATRNYLLENLKNTHLEPNEIENIISECTFGRRVDPMVDIDSYGKADVASNLKKQGILDANAEEELFRLVKEIKKNIPGKKDFEPLKILFINATEFGGGVAEMRPNNARFMKEFNVVGDWAVIDGCEEFYKATVHIHEGIQNPNYPPIKKKEIEVLDIISILNFCRFEDLKIFNKYDVIWIDDPQPLGMLPMIKALHPEKPVVWRCHVHADPEDSIREYIANILEGHLCTSSKTILCQYMHDNHNINLGVFPREKLRINAAIFHLEEFSEGLGLSEDIPCHIMGPAIDPLSFKNMPLSKNFILATLARYGIVKAKKHDEKYQMRLERKKSIALGEVPIDIESEGSNGCGEDSEWSNKVPPYILEVSRYDPYKGPFEVVVSFIEAMRKLDCTHKEELFVKENCIFVFAASTPGDNPTGAQILANLENFLSNCDLLKRSDIKSLRERIFLLSLKDKRRSETIRKILFDKIWEKEEHKKEMMVKGVLDRHVYSSLEKIIEKLTEGNEPIVSKEAAEILMHEGKNLSNHNNSAYFTLEQINAAADCIASLDCLGAETWRKAKENELSGKEINHLEVNALQTGAFVRCQFSSKEGFGLVVSEAMVKHEQCDPPVNGIMVATTVGGVKSQVKEKLAIPVDYPREDVEESLLMYRLMEEKDVNNSDAANTLYNSIAKRQSVKDFSNSIVKAIRMEKSQRELMSRSARNFILNNFAIHSNVHNILDSLSKVFARFQKSAH